MLGGVSGDISVRGGGGGGVQMAIRPRIRL